MMPRQMILLAVPLCYLAASADAFGVSTPVAAARTTCAFSRPLSLPSSSSIGRRILPTSWRLHAEEETAKSEAPSAEGEDHGEHTGPEWELPSEGSSDILNSPAFLRRKIDVLKSDIEKVEQETDEANAALEAGKAEWGGQIDDLQKEYLLMQERMARQSKEGGGVATQEVVRKILEVMDNYERAFGVIEPNTDEEKEIDAAYRKTYQMILDTFETLGVSQVETVGTEFDYEVHQAVMQRPSEYEEGIVCEELAPGWVMGDKLIRAAMVSVSAG